MRGDGTRAAEFPGLLILLVENRIEAKPAALQRVREFGEESGWPASISNEVELVLEEWLTNVISYGFPDRNRAEIQVAISHKPGALVLEISDPGVPFNPATYASPNLAVPLEERPIGGLGIHMIKSLVDNLEYQRRENSNVLLLRKSSVHPKLTSSK